jgi:hypothetical protein
MKQKTKTTIMWGIRLLLLGATFFFLIRAGNYFDSGFRYTVETSSSPNPSQEAKTLGPVMMHNFKLFLIYSVASLALLLLSFIKRTKRPLTTEK